MLPLIRKPRMSEAPGSVRLVGMKPSAVAIGTGNALAVHNLGTVNFDGWPTFMEFPDVIDPIRLSGD